MKRGKRHIFLMNVRQILSSPILYLCIVMVAVLCAASVKETVFDVTIPRIDLAYVMDLLMDLSLFQQLVILLAAIPTAAGFCNDWCCQFIRPVVTRSGIHRYALSKLLICALTSFLVVMIGMTLFFSVMSLYLPAAHDNPINAPVPPYGSLLEGPAPFLYILCVASLFALSASLWAVVGLAVSARLPNKFVAVSTPLIASYLVQELTKSLPPQFNLYYLSRARNILGQGAAVSFLYSAFVFMALIGLAGYFFYVTVQRRVQNELV